MKPPYQTTESVEANRAFFAANDGYAANLARLTTYRNIRAAVSEAIAGTTTLLDIGNGGVFDYDTSVVDQIVGVDLFLDAESERVVPGNVTLRHGDALALSEPDAAYDVVLMVSVLHHLIGTDVPGTVENMRRAIGEARRVLGLRGKLVVMESCIPRWAYPVERRLFGALQAVAGTRLLEHPAALQLPPSEIERLLRERFSDVAVQRIPAGRLILQFGHRWPTALTPARPYLFTAS